MPFSSPFLTRSPPLLGVHFKILLFPFCVVVTFPVILCGRFTSASHFGQLLLFPSSPLLPLERSVTCVRMVVRVRVRVGMCVDVCVCVRL